MLLSIMKTRLRGGWVKGKVSSCHTGQVLALFKSRIKFNCAPSASVPHLCIKSGESRYPIIMLPGVLSPTEGMYLTKVPGKYKPFWKNFPTFWTAALDLPTTFPGARYTVPCPVLAKFGTMQGELYSFPQIVLTFSFNLPLKFIRGLRFAKVPTASTIVLPCCFRLFPVIGEYIIYVRDKLALIAAPDRFIKIILNCNLLVWSQPCT